MRADTNTSDGLVATAQGYEELSLLGAASFVLKRRRSLLVTGILGGLIGLAFGQFAPLKFTATATFLPHGGEQGSLSGVAGLAQQFGLMIPRDGLNAFSPEFYQDLLRSREILDDVINPGVDIVDGGKRVHIDLAQHFEIEADSEEEQSARVRLYLVERVISASVGRETGVVSLSVRTDDALLSAAIGRRLLDLIQAFDIQTRQSQASAERRFAEVRLAQLEAERGLAEDSLKAFLTDNRRFDDSPQLAFEHDRLQRQVLMRQDLVTAMAQAYEQARIDEVRNTPVLTVIDEPDPPALPDRRRRPLKLLLGMSVGLLGGFGLAVLGESRDRTRVEDSRTYSEFQKLLGDAKRDPLGVWGGVTKRAPAGDTDA